MAQQTISKMETVQTAVEWLIEQLEQQVYTINHKDNRVIPKSFDDIIGIKKQAKAMEKQQLANSWDKACDQYIYRDGNLVKVWADFDKYYKETYGSNNKI